MSYGDVLTGLHRPDRSDVRRYARLARANLRVGLTRLRLGVAPSPRPMDPDRAIESLPPSPHVLFLCLGNICRSPFAEHLLRERLADRDLDGVTVESGGFIEEEGRPSPDEAVAVGREHDVRLDDRSSACVTEETLRRSDIVLLMDASNYEMLSRQFGWATDRTWFLDAFTDADGYEIRDPNGGDHAEFREVYGRVSDAVDGFVRRLERDRR